LRLMDTAGIRETEDLVEQIGVDKSREVLQEADLILLVLNYAEALTEEDRRLFELVSGRKTIIIVNKTDLPKKIDLNEVKQLNPESKLITISIKEEKGIEELEKAIGELYFTGELETEDPTYVSNVRHINLLKQANQA